MDSSTITNHLQTPLHNSESKALEPKVIEKIVTHEVVKFVPKTKIVYVDKKEKKDDKSSKDDPFVVALNNGKFYDAMNYYEEADEERHPFYQTLLVGYFNKEKIKSPTLTIEQMQYFIEMEPTCKLIIWELAQLFAKSHQYENALDLLVDFSYVAAYKDKKIVELMIKNISFKAISTLTVADDFGGLVDFLQNRINIGILSEFYEFELGKAYLAMKKYLDSKSILTPLAEDETYKERVNEILTLIDIKLEELEEYPIQIPLIKKGSHFYVRAKVEETSVLLLIDTGASITSIDNSLVNHLEVFRENVTFHTAAGDIQETIFKATSFSIGATSLENFTVIGSSYPNQGFNGLLGMNFLGKFKFKIDQNEAILFLGKKY